jgi:hypothetical protein
MGKKAYGVSAGAAEIHFTVRSDSNEKMQRLKKSQGSYFDCGAIPFKMHSSWTQKFYANENNQQQSNIF